MNAILGVILIVLGAAALARTLFAVIWIWIRLGPPEEVTFSWRTVTLWLPTEMIAGGSYIVVGLGGCYFGILLLVCGTIALLAK